MPTPLTHAERVAIARLHALLELLPTALDRHLAPAGITSFEYTLLEALAEAPGRLLRLSALASRTNATLPRLSRVVTALERRGLVERIPCPSDRRATNARLTDAGAALQRESADRYAEGARSLILDGLATLPGDGVAQLTELSYAILSALDPEQRLAVTAAGAGCAADPAPAAEPGTCPADPAPATDRPVPDAGSAVAETLIFGADWCGDCRRAKLVFDRAGAPYRYVDLVAEPAAAEIAQEISGRTNIPVIVYPDATHQVEPSNADMLRRIAELGLGTGPAA